ncbi:MAG: signal peptidase I [Acutalibacteraceae bacterium]
MRVNEEYWIEFSPSGSEDEKKAPLIWRLLYDWTDSAVGSVFIIFLLFAFIFRPVGVDGTSMVPTLNSGDWVAITGFTSKPRRGDIVVITQPNEVREPLIKRVIAVGGDTVNIDFQKREVSINGKVLNEPYISEPTHRFFDVSFPLTVPEGKIFVMGDNRNNSKDSRSSGIGFIDERYVLGRAWFRFYPFKSWHIEYSSFSYD